MRILDYTMFSYVVTYTARVHVRDELGETTGVMEDKVIQVHPKVVARNRAMADAWIQERYNASYQKHTSFSFHCIQAEEAPHLLIEWTR